MGHLCGLVFWAYDNLVSVWVMISWLWDQALLGSLWGDF